MSPIAMWVKQLMLQKNAAAFERSDVAAREEEPKIVEVIVTDERENGNVTQVFEVGEGVDEREAGELTQGLGVDVGVEVDVKMKMSWVEGDLKLKLDVLEREAGERTQGVRASERTQEVEVLS